MLYYGDNFWQVWVIFGIAGSMLILTTVQPANFRKLARRISHTLLAKTIHKPSGFNLRVGMTNHEVYAELHRKTAGETEQEVKFLLSPDHSEGVKTLVKRAIDIFGVNMIGPALEVVEANERYAVIKKTRLYNYDGDLRKDIIYYLTGINDEGYYFVHAIEDPTLPDEGTMPKGDTHHLERLVDYINRTADGFKRLQGDVLYKFQYIDSSADNIYEPYYKVRLTENVNTSRPKYKLTRPLDEPVLEPIQLGNHLIYHTGHTWGQDGYEIILGTKVIMKHPQHKDVTLDIPRGHAAILTHQRSRNVEVPDTRIVRSNYD